MKPLLLLLPLALLAAAPAPPAGRVVFTPIGPGVYVQAWRQALNLPEAQTWPLKKKQGVLRVPTAAGYRAFRDKTGPQDTDAVTYAYLGYLPRARQHLLLHSYWEAEERLVDEVLAVRPDGSAWQLLGVPCYAPDLRHALVFRQSPDFEGADINEVQLLDTQPGPPRPLWEATPDWEPVELFWVSATTAYLKQRRAANGAARYTYARLTVRQ